MGGSMCMAVTYGMDGGMNSGTGMYDDETQSEKDLRLEVWEMEARDARKMKTAESRVRKALDNGKFLRKFKILSAQIAWDVVAHPDRFDEHVREAFEQQTKIGSTLQQALISLQNAEVDE